MSSSKEAMNSIKWCATSFDTTKLPASMSRNNSVNGRDVFKYSYNLGIFSPEIEEMSNGDCDKEDSKEIGLSKAMKVTYGLGDQLSSSYFHTNIPTKKNSFAITSYLQKHPVSPSPSIRKSRVDWEPKQDFAEVNFIPPTSESPQITCSEIKKALTNSENEAKSHQMGIDKNTLAKSILFVPVGEYTTINSDNIVKEKQSNVFQVPLSPTTKFRRAARRLGVLIPSEELHKKQRRNGVCEAMDKDADQRKLLRVLNKRF